MTQMRKQFWVVLTAIAILLGALAWEQAGIVSVATRHQAVRVSIILGLPIIVILSIRGLIAVVTDKVEIDAPEVYEQVRGVGKFLFLAVATSSGFVMGLSALLRGHQVPQYLQYFGVIATASSAGIATLCWRRVWNTCIALRAYRCGRLRS